MLLSSVCVLNRRVESRLFMTDARDGSPLFVGTPLTALHASKEAMRDSMHEVGATSRPLEARPRGAAFDFGRSTQENHYDPEAEYIGRHRNIRARLDAEYHGRYTRARQLLQDQLLDDALRLLNGCMHIT